MNSKVSVLILMGSPGAGKGTQAELLSDKLNLTYIETSKILEEKFWNAKEGEYMEAEGKKYFLLDEKKLWQTGMLNSPPFVTALMKEKIQNLFHQQKSLLLAGSPRTIHEGKEEMPLFENLYGKENIRIIEIKVSEKESLFRNSHRRLCSLMRHPILYSKETENLTLCPLDGSLLQKREGLDDPETIKVRFKEYRERTFPLIEYFKKGGFFFKEINGNQPVADVFSDILHVLQEQ
ncbi:MAG: nucleoside monophosphate kinase [Candidatus Wildermuthbacteria bacterium]|nr:nucleoside monophosphate kinase [Candidatus Wildermuthbacteria bacterium]